MTQEDKDLLLKDLCARLPYGVMVSVQGVEFDSYKYPYQLTAVSKFGLDSFCKVYHPIYTPFGVVPNVEYIKPYLRPMSSMTDDERKEYNDIVKNTIDFYNCPKSEKICFFIIPIEWLNKHHFDYRGLIEKGLALEAPEGMYKID